MPAWLGRGRGRRLAAAAAASASSPSFVRRCGRCVRGRDSGLSRLWSSSSTYRCHARSLHDVTTHRGHIQALGAHYWGERAPSRQATPGDCHACICRPASPPTSTHRQYANTHRCLSVSAAKRGSSSSSGSASRYRSSGLGRPPAAACCCWVGMSGCRVRAAGRRRQERSGTCAGCARAGARQLMQRTPPTQQAGW